VAASAFLGDKAPITPPAAMAPAVNSPAFTRKSLLEEPFSDAILEFNLHLLE
jgi:hypothetical protein